MNNISKCMWGVVLIFIGVVIGLNTFNISNINIFFEGWWTLFIIVPSFIGLFDKDDNKTSNIIGLVIGISLLLASRKIITFEVVARLAVPFILVMIGISLIFNESFIKCIRNKKNSIKKQRQTLDNIIATFSNNKTNYDNEEFKSANIEAVFGGVTLDLRNARIDNGAFINANCVFGGIDIFLGDDVNVKIKQTSIFGEISNKIRNKESNEKTIYIDCFTIFGGINIK